MGQGETRDKGLYLTVILLTGILVYLAPYALSETGAAANYRNVSVSTSLNITNSIPEILNMTAPASVTLNAGGQTVIQCNATVRDFDGISTLQDVNATFFDADNVTYGSPDDNNTHYFNSSCTTGDSGQVGNYTCNLTLEYYANSGANWNCTIAVKDDFNATASDSAITNISEVIALNVTNALDFGDLEVGDISSSQEANVTNFGNTRINVSVYGYGAVPGDGLAMDCTQGNISIEEQKYSLNSAEAWINMTPLNITNEIFTNLTLDQRVNDSAGGEIMNSTYWKIRVPNPSNPNGVCNGTIVFQAESA